jgi:hypothetical protein
MAGSTEETNNKTNGTVTVKYDGNLDELPEWRAGHTLDARKKRFGYTLDNLRNGTGDEQAQLSIASVLYKTLGPKLSAQYADLFNDESNMIVGTTLWNSITASDLNDKSLSSQVLAFRIFCDLMRDNMQGLGDFADAVSMAITRCRNSGILAFMKGTADTAAAEQLAKIKLLAAINLSAESTLVSELISKDLSYDELTSHLRTMQNQATVASKVAKKEDDDGPSEEANYGNWAKGGGKGKGGRKGKGTGKEPTQTCHFYSKHGKCKYGDNCRFKHDPSAAIKAATASLAIKDKEISKLKAAASANADDDDTSSERSFEAKVARINKAQDSNQTVCFRGKNVKVSNLWKFLWIIDSGCSRHMTPYESDFTDLQYSSSGSINGISKSNRLSATGQGSVSLTISGNRSHHFHSMEDTLLVPDMSAR